jgi:alpha-L-fucosidase
MLSFMLSIVFMIMHDRAKAQVQGDEDQNMFNHAQQRDQQAIEEAKSSWWTNAQKTQSERLIWWREAKYGMFIHWGIYSDPAGEWKGKKVEGYAEHLMRKEQLSKSEYSNLALRFNPKRFHAEEWILKAKDAGMNYFIVTAKHHDGFALWNSKVSEFDIFDQTPFKRDPMGELAAAAKKHGIRFGFYYSHAFDWEHPDAPGNDWEYANPGGDKLLGGTNWFDTHPEWLPKAAKYVDEKAIPQIKELIANYHPDILWFDTPHKLPLSENLRILKAIREADPHIVVNGRLARSSSFNFGDYINTGDRPAEFRSVGGDWEAIPTTNESYGYSRHDKSHKPARFFIQLLAKASAKGGNLLINIGPKGDGSFDTKDSQILDSIGSWIRKNKESIYGTRKSSIPVPSWGVITEKPGRLYLHVFNWPKDGILELGGLKNKVLKAYVLTDPRGRSLKVKQVGEADFSIGVPLESPDDADAVVVVDIAGDVQSDGERRITSKEGVYRLLAFDADIHGDGFSFGDGKANRYFAEGWKSANDYLTWDLKMLHDSKYRLLARYLPVTEPGMAYDIRINGSSFKMIPKGGTKDIPVLQELGIIDLPASSYRLSVKRLHTEGTELFKLLEMQLIPLVK